VEFELVLAGDGEMRAEAEQFIADQKLGSESRITGWTAMTKSGTKLLAARALIYQLCRRLAGRIMEAMALRRPVISTFIAAHSGTSRAEQTWLAVPAGDVEALMTAIQGGLGNRDGGA